MHMAQRPIRWSDISQPPPNPPPYPRFDVPMPSVNWPVDMASDATLVSASENRKNVWLILSFSVAKLFLKIFSRNRRR